MRKRAGEMGSFSTDNRTIRKFGGICLCFFGILSAIAMWRHKTITTYIFGFLSLLGVGFLLIPGRLSPIHKGWLKLANFIRMVLSIVILTVVYYVVMTPTAFIKGMLGGRPLPTAPDKNATTYWVSRSEPAQPRERFIKRY